MSDTPSSSFTRFDFDNDFFEVVPAGGAASSAPKKASPPRTFREAGEQGYEKGFTQGRAEGHQEAETAFTEKLNALTARLDTELAAFMDAHATAQKELEQDMLGVLRHALAKLVSHAQQNYTDDILTQHIQDVLTEVQDHQALTLKIHPDATPTHKSILSGTSNLKPPKTIRVKGDDTLGPADVVLEWASGGLDKRLPDLMKRLDNLLLSAGATPTPGHPSPTQTAQEAVTKRADALLSEDDDLVDDLKEEKEETDDTPTPETASD